MVQFWVPLVHGPSRDGQAALEAALEALDALALTLSKTLGLISLALELVLSGAQDCKWLCAVALRRGSRLALALVLSRAQDYQALSSCSSARRWRSRLSRSSSRWRSYSKHAGPDQHGAWC